MLKGSLESILSAGRPAISFEFFPPRTLESEARFWLSLRELEKLGPDFVSVTYGAGGSSQDRTVDVLESVASETTLLPLGHLTAVNQSVADLRRVIGRFAAAGVCNVLALRGDPPGDPQGPWCPHPGGVEYAYQLVELLKQSGRFCVGVTAHPTKHPRSVDIEADVGHFLDKCRAGADFAITQMFFRADDYLRFRDRVSSKGGTVPIIPEIMPITNVKQITRFAELAGSELPADLADRLNAASGNAAAVTRIGIEESLSMAQLLLDEGAPGLHFITLNRTEPVREILSQLDLPAPHPAHTLAFGAI